MFDRCIIALSFLAVCGFAEAANCDLALVKSAYNSSLVTHADWRLSTLVTRDSYDEAKKDAGVSAVIYGVPVSANYDEYSQKREQMFQSHNESMSVDVVRNIAWTGIDPNAVTAYSRCLETEILNSDGLHAVVRSASKSDISIVVKWFAPGLGDADVIWDPKAVENKTLPTLIKRGITTIRVPRPSSELSLSGNYNGYTTLPLLLEPLPIATPPVACLAKSIKIPAKNFDPDLSKNIQIGVLPYGYDVIHNAPDYGVDKENLAVYRFSFPCSGRYNLFIEYAAAQPRPVQLDLSDNLGFKFQTEILKTATGAWAPPVDTFQATIDSIPVGEVSLQLYRAHVFPHIRTIRFEPAG
jgi:hypothetical protein